MATYEERVAAAATLLAIDDEASASRTSITHDELLVLVRVLSDEIERLNAELIHAEDRWRTRHSRRLIQR